MSRVWGLGICNRMYFYIYIYVYTYTYLFTHLGICRVEGLELYRITTENQVNKKMQLNGSWDDPGILGLMARQDSEGLVFTISAMACL